MLLLLLLLLLFLGAAYSRAEQELRLLLVRANLPFLPTPMGKGILPDDHPLCVAAARSKYCTVFLCKVNFRYELHVYLNFLDNIHRYIVHVHVHVCVSL